jgi:hypothetical protein
MKHKTTLAAVIGPVILLAAQAAQAACVDPGIAPGPNDVSLDGFAFESASAPPPPLGFEVDMNGIQRGNDQLLWATHGTLVILQDVQDQEPVWVASWTKNTRRETEEWVCRMRLEPGTLTLFGNGAVHRQSGGATSSTLFEECKMDLVADCF